MADILLSSMVRSMVRNLNSLGQQELGIAWGLGVELENLERTLSTIQTVLQDAEEKQWKGEAVKNWLRMLKDGAYDADDVLDEFAFEVLRRKLEGQKGVRSQVSGLFSLQNPLIFRMKMAHKLKSVRDRLEAISKVRSKFHLSEEAIDMDVFNIERKTGSHLTKSEIYGRGEEKKKIIEVLLNMYDQDNLVIYAIWGIGGLGKTTLAQHYEMRIWVTIIESIDGSTCGFLDLDPLQQHLQDKLRGRKFLIVLDDVWNDDRKKWDDLKDMFGCGEKGMKKCGRVPLAIKALGSLLSLKNRKSEWTSVKESEIWNLLEAENSILPVQRLSYHHLPPHLKQCFAYCCVFPKGPLELHDVGLDIFNELEDVPGKKKCKMHDLMHDLAQSIMRFECLSVESIKGLNLKVSKRIRHLSFPMNSSKAIPCIMASPDFYGEYKAFLPLFLKQKYLRVWDYGYKAEKALSSIRSLNLLRYLNMSHSNIEVLPESTTCLVNLQTLKLDYCHHLHTLPKDMKQMKNLRYFGLTNCNSLTRMPKHIGQLTCLKSLSLFIVDFADGHQLKDFNKLTLLPDVLLRNHKMLVSLRIYYLCELESLANQFNSLSALKYLEISYCNKLQSLPEGIQKLCCLQSLHILCCYRFASFQMFGFGGLSSLRKLWIEKCEAFCSLSEGIQYLTALEELCLDKCPELISLPEGIRHLTNLRTLQL
ncbi:hypothetical protein ACJW31_07G118300 [Castanea mollissima]